MPVEGPEGELHAHDYRIEVVIGRAELDDAGMVVDLDPLRASIAELLGPIRDADLETIRPPEREAVTVEVFARWAHDALAERLRPLGAGSIRVRVWESPTEFGGYGSDAPPGTAGPADRRTGEAGSLAD
jgi:6-pyruvoyl-tetrahydropterin synthase